MSEEIQVETPADKTPAEIREASKQALRDAVDRQEALREERTIAALVESLDTQSKRITPEQEVVREAIKVVAPAPASKVPARSAARTVPANLSDWRYRTLPAWQQEFRSADDDVMVARFFRGLWMAKEYGDTRLLNEVRDEDKLAREAILIGAPSGTDGAFQGTGGELLPLPVSTYIQIALYRLARFRSLARVFTATTGTSLRVPKQSAISSSAWKAEAAEITDGSPAAQDHLNLVLQKLTTLGTLSNEIIEDDVFGVTQWLISDVVMQMAETEDESLYSSGAGAASEEPNGLEAHDVPAGQTPIYQIPLGAAQVADYSLVADGDLDYAHIVKMFYSLPEKKRANAIWTGPDSVMEALSLLVDGTGRPIFREQNAAVGTIGDPASSAQTGTILGKPVHNLPGQSVPLGANVDGSDDNRLYFMEPMRTYGILEKGDIRVSVSTDAEFVTDQTLYKFIRRVDGGVLGNTITGRFDYIFTGGIDTVPTP